MADEEEKFSGGPDARATKNLDKYYDRVVDLNDQLKFATSLIKDRTTIEKQSINLSNQLVNAVQKMKKGYSDTKEVQKDLSKFSGKANELELQRTKILKDNQGINQKALQLAANIEKGLVNQKATLAQMQSDKAKGLKIDTELEAKIQSQVAGQEKGLATRIKGMAEADRQVYILNKTKGEVDSIVKGLEEENKHQEKINTNMGLTGKLMTGIGKIPIIGQFTNADKVLEKMRDHAGEVDENGNLINNKFSTMKEGIKEAGKQIVEGMMDPLVIITALIKSGLQFDKQLTDLQKGMGVSREEATGLRNEMSTAAAATGDMAINSERMLKTFSMLQGQLGIAASFSTQMTADATVLSEKVGLSDKATGNFAKSSLVVGKSIDEQYKGSLGIVSSIRAATGVAIPFKETLEKAANVGGQIRAQMGGSLEEITKAVATASALGMELEQVAAAGNSMLNFQSSIESELEAELLTGKQLNLEKARLAALTGDYATLAKEINKEAGTFSDFQKMNVLQQNALAKSFGMSADEMSNMMMDQEVLNKSAAQLRAEGKDSLADRLEARNVEEQMADAVMKLKGVFVDLVGGPVGAFLNIMTAVLEPINMILTSMGKVFGMFTGTTKEMSKMELIIGAIGVGAAAYYATVKAAALIEKGRVVVQKVMLAFKNSEIIKQNILQRKQNVSLMKGIGNAMMAAIQSLGKIPVIGAVLGLAAAGTVAALGAKYVAKAEKGGMIGGNRHSQGGTIIEAEQGEFIMSRQGVQNVGVGNLYAMNKGGGISGGKAQAGGEVSSNSGMDMSGFTDAVLNAVKAPGVVVASPYGLNDAQYQSRNENFKTRFE
tara:strand:+ start:1128 stop:3623 length:2496 start_codon:yes stop_codon:yes gene_type:complete